MYYSIIKDNYEFYYHDKHICAQILNAIHIYSLITTVQYIQRINNKI